jgi:hypothetical protein
LIGDESRFGGFARAEVLLVFDSRESEAEVAVMREPLSFALVDRNLDGEGKQERKNEQQRQTKGNKKE